MPTPSFCDRLTLRVVLLKVSPLVARLISVPDDLSLEDLHHVLQLVLGWSGQAFYNFRIHDQEIGRRRRLRTHLLREFQLRLREKFLYTYDFLDLWEWEIRVLDIEPGSAVAWQVGPRRHRKSAAVRAGTCEFWISTSTIRPWQNRNWSRRPCNAWRKRCRTRVIETCSRNCSIKGWRGPYNGSKNTCNFNRSDSQSKDTIIKFWRMRCSYPGPEMFCEFELREPLKSFASEKYTVGLNGFVEFEMLSEPQIAAGDSIQIDACEPG
jgi:hypothetical protein